MSTKSARYEKLIEWYLRFNGYFTVNSYVLHNVQEVFHLDVGSYSEIDSMGIRLPYSFEDTGVFEIQNHPPLINSLKGKIDFVISEVKSGKNNKPNNIWKDHNPEPIAYILKFMGLFKSEKTIQEVSEKLLQNYKHEDSKCRIRYIIFSKTANKHYQKEGVTYIPFNSILKFIVKVRGECWVNNDTGIKSNHPQWDDFINEIISIANQTDDSVEFRVSEIFKILDQH